MPECTVDTCPISASTLGYRPNVFSSIFFIAFYGAAAIIQTAQGIRYRTWSFSAAMVLGCVFEAGGYPGRLMLHDNPFSAVGFDMQICMLTIAPAFLSAGIYFMLKHLVIAYSTSCSRIEPHWYPKIFIPCDVVSLVLQATGGALAASAGHDDRDIMDAGNNVMMAGLGFQVFTLAIFAVLAGEFTWRVRRADPLTLNPKTYTLRSSLKHKLFLLALFVAFWSIMFRCIYRIIEMAGGWGNEIMQDELTFIILDSSLCGLAALVLTIWHPGYCFNYLAINADTTDIYADIEKDNQRPLSEASMWRPCGEAFSSTEFEMEQKDRE